MTIIGMYEEGMNVRTIPSAVFIVFRNTNGIPTDVVIFRGFDRRMVIQILYLLLCES